MPIKTGNIEIKQKAPNFTIPVRQTDGITSTACLKDYKGQHLVLYFYPKDDTPSCTTQAIDFTSHLQAFKALNATILGVSADPLTKHEKFANKHNLNITLGSDETQNMLKSYGCWVEKNMYGRKYMGIERSTFLIAPDSKIKYLWRKVKVKTHIEEVLAALEG